MEGEGIGEGIGNEAGKFYRDESNESMTPILKNIQKSGPGGINKEAQLESQDYTQVSASNYLEDLCYNGNLFSLF